MKGLADRVEFDGYVEFVKETAVKMFLRSGTVLPHALVIATQHPETREPFDRGAMAVPTITADALQSAEDYESFIGGIRAAAIASKAVGVIAISEAWFVMVKTHDEVVDVPPSLNDDSFGGRRREAIIITIDHLAYPATVRWAAVIHRLGPKPSLSRWVSLPLEQTIMRERFSAAFPRELWQ